MTLSPRAYNAKVGLGLFCPITSAVKGYPFEVAFPNDCKTTGVALSDQVKSLDWRVRRARRFDHAPADVVQDVLAKVRALLDP